MEIKILYFILEAFTLTIVMLAAIWIYRDAKKRGMVALLWGYVALFLPVIGWVIYLLVRSPLYGKPCPDCIERIESGDSLCNGCPYNFKNIAEEKGLIPSFKKISLKEKFKAFIVGAKYILKINKREEKTKEEANK